MLNVPFRWSEYFYTPDLNLRNYFKRVVRGQPNEYRTTFFKDRDVADVLDEWANTLLPGIAEWPSLCTFEEDLRSKVGPMSIMKPLKERMKDIDSYYDAVLLGSEPLDPAAIDAVVREFGGSDAAIAIRKQRDTYLKSKKSTNSGSPYFTKRERVANRTLPCSMEVRDFEVFQSLGKNEESWKAAAVLGWRGQEGGPSRDDVKQRVVWMFPMAVNICELQVYQPLIEHAQRSNLVPAWIGNSAVDASITKLFDTKGKDELVVCTDFSKFDQHFNADCQAAARAILTALLQPGEASENWLEHVFPIKYVIPLAYNHNRIRFGPHGMGSGSGGTNCDETLLHRALQYEAALHHGAELNPHSQCLGDDGMLSYPGITVEQVVDTYTSHGQEMNVSKQYASAEDCVYLRRWHHRDYRVNGICVGVYSTFRALGRMLEQERYYDPEVWGPKMVALRQLSILENVKYHPMREEFADFCMKGDKYRLGIDIPGFLDGIEGIARQATSDIPDLLGYNAAYLQGIDSEDAAPIKDWWIVRYLRSKSR